MNKTLIPRCVECGAQAPEMARLFVSEDQIGMTKHTINVSNG